MTWAPDYLDDALLKRYLRIDDNADDAFIALWITTVSRNIDDFCSRQFGQVAAAEDRYYPVRWDPADRAWWADVDDLQDLTGLTFTGADGTVLGASSWSLYPRNAAVKGRPYERVRMTACPGREVTGHGVWGWSAQPAAVGTGMLLQASRLNKRRESPFGISGSPQQQGEIRLLAQLDVDFRIALKPLQRSWWAA